MVFGLFGGSERMEATYREVTERTGMAPVDFPLGLSDDWLEGSFVLLPGGDRDRSAVWGMQADTGLALAGTTIMARVAAFEWWWEQRHHEHNSNGPDTTRWERESLCAALVQLPDPANLPGIRVEREGVFSRLGIGGRGDFQVESEELNRTHDIRTTDRAQAIRLFDAHFQAALLGPHAGSSFEMGGSFVLVVAGTPHTRLLAGESRRGREPGIAGWFSRSGDLVRHDEGIVEGLPEVAQRARALLEDFPTGFWRVVTGGAAGR